MIQRQISFRPDTGHVRNGNTIGVIKMPGVSELGKMSKSQILQKYRPKILELGGKDELRLIKETFSVKQLREYVEDFFAPGPDGKYNKGGVIKANAGASVKPNRMSRT